MSVISAVWGQIPEPMKYIARAGRNALMTARVRASLTGDGFAAQAAEHVLKYRRHHIETPVLDTARFPNAAVSRPNPSNVFAVLSLIRRRADDIDRLGAALSDDYSRETMKELLAYRAFGPSNVALAGSSLYGAKLAQAERMKKGPATANFPPFEMGLYQTSGDDDRPIELACWLINTLYTFVERQYFLTRDAMTISPKKGDVVIDAGACFGDTALLFASAVGERGQIHSFEPLARQREVYQANVARNPHLAGSLHLHPWAVADKSERKLKFTDGGAGARASASGDVTVTTMSIDDFIDRQGLSSVDFIKMDIEGAETSALLGATQTIRRFRPRLAISIYHSLDDLIGLPLLVKELAPDYDLYIGHHTIHIDETILYGCPR